MKCAGRRFSLFPGDSSFIVIDCIVIFFTLLRLTSHFVHLAHFSCNIGNQIPFFFFFWFNTRWSSWLLEPFWMKNTSLWTFWIQESCPWCEEKKLMLRGRRLAVFPFSYHCVLRVVLHPNYFFILYHQISHSS